MPLLSPLQIHNVLKETSLTTRELSKGEETLEELLEASSLGKREVLNTVGDLMRGADTSSVRLSAAKLGAQFHGLIDKDNGIQMPSLTIVIRDSEFSVNPILIPRHAAPLGGESA